MAADRFVVVADYRKDSQVLGTQWEQGVPLEVLFVSHFERTLAGALCDAIIRCAAPKTYQ
jgi:ribose 5-phosphate isomerase